MPAATATKEPSTPVGADTERVCLITGPETHSEPMTFTGPNAKRALAIHQSKSHGIKSKRNGHRVKTKTTRTRAKKVTRTLKRKAATLRKAARRPVQPRTPRGLSYRVQPALVFSMQFAPMRIARAELNADGVLSLYDADGAVKLSGQATAALR